MRVLGLNHFNITVPSELLERVRDFYVEIVGLAVGERPGFRREGFWLYAGDEPLVHLTASEKEDAPRVEGALSFLDHVAFSCRGLREIVERLTEFEIPFEVVEIDSLKQVQVFLQDPARVGVELNFVNESLA